MKKKGNKKKLLTTKVFDGFPAFPIIHPLKNQKGYIYGHINHLTNAIKI